LAFAPNLGGLNLADLNLILGSTGGHSPVCGDCDGELHLTLTAHFSPILGQHAGYRFIFWRG